MPDGTLTVKRRKSDVERRLFVPKGFYWRSGSSASIFDMSLTGLRHYPHKSPPSAVAWQFVSSRRTAASAYDENGLQMGSALSCECFDAAKEEAQLEVVPNTQSEEKTEKTILIVGGVKYIGEVKNGQKHGYGVLIRPCGSRFEGHFKNGVAHGEGKFFHPSGDKYEGQWKDNRATGKGKFTHADGSCYEGDWVCDVQQGEGVEKWIDGSSYKGQYKGGMKHGKGAFMWPDGSVYEGQFEENDIHGFGTYTWGDKKRYTGQWVHNHMDGQGQMRLADGRIHEGGYRYDKKHGKGKVIWPDGRWFEGEWVDGRQHGIGCYFSADGRPVSEVEWSFGKKISSTEAAANAVPESPALEGLQDGGRGVSDSTSLSNVREATAKEGGAPEKAEEEQFTPRNVRGGPLPADAKDGQEDMTPKHAASKGWMKIGSKKKKEKHEKDRNTPESVASPSPDGAQAKKKKGFSLFGKKDGK